MSEIQRYRHSTVSRVSRELNRISDAVDIETATTIAKTEVELTQLDGLQAISTRAMQGVAMVAQLEQQLAIAVPLATSRLRYRALTGTGRRTLERDIEHGFPFLPSGSQIVLDRVSQQVVLANVRAQLAMTRRQLVADVRSYSDVSLAQYLHEAGRELPDIYRSNRSWTVLRRDAGLATPPPGPDKDALLRRVAAFAHVDDRERAEAYSQLADRPVRHTTN